MKKNEREKDASDRILDCKQADPLRLEGNWELLGSKGVWTSGLGK